MFFYSERPKTLAERKFEDDIPLEIKKRRLAEIQELQQQMSYDAHKKLVGKTFEVLVEGESKRSKDQLFGRNSQNVTVIFPKEDYQPGDYVNVKIEDFTSATVTGIAVK